MLTQLVEISRQVLVVSPCLLHGSGSLSLLADWYLSLENCQTQWELHEALHLLALQSYVTVAVPV